MSYWTKRLAFIFPLGLGLVAYWSYCHSFAPTRWAGHNRVEDHNNPRAWMVDDLLADHFPLGLSRDSVLQLLGQPQWEGVTRRLPDSLRSQFIRLPVDSMAHFLQMHDQPDTLLQYPIGWTVVDPNFLTIRLNGQRRVSGAWIENH